MGLRTKELVLTPVLASSLALPVAATDVVARTIPHSPALKRSILRYWTPERMAGALAWGVPAGSRSLARTVAGRLWPGGGTVARTSGKVFFTLGGRDYLCSATTVAGASRDLVVTAGHCVKDGRGAWASKWIFVPGYRDGSGPYGAFTARRMFVAEPWSASGDGDFDVAMVALSHARGRHVADTVGAQRIAFGGPRGRQTYVVGYPSEGRYDGERLAYCGGRPRSDPNDSTTSQGLRCGMTRGSSGGAWLTGFDPATGMGTVTSVSSFKYAGDSTMMYGPYFGDAIQRLYQRAQRA